jgi:hypothetical protein
MAKPSIETDLENLRTKLPELISADRKIRDDADERIRKNEALLKAIKAAGENTVSAGYGSKRANLLAAIDKISKSNFGMSDVETALNALGTPFEKAVLRTGLWTLADKGEIKLVKKGTNSSPAEYAKNNGAK